MQRNINGHQFWHLAPCSITRHQNYLPWYYLVADVVTMLSSRWILQQGRGLTQYFLKFDLILLEMKLTTEYAATENWRYKMMLHCSKSDTRMNGRAGEEQSQARGYVSHWSQTRMRMDSWVWWGDSHQTLILIQQSCGGGQKMLTLTQTGLVACCLLTIWSGLMRIITEGTTVKGRGCFRIFQTADNVKGWGRWRIILFWEWQYGDW